MDQTGAPFTTADLAGRALVVDFIYTHCTDACPVLSAGMARLQGLVAADSRLAPRVVLASISVDPLHDTPAALATYGRRYGADPARWRLLTGDWDAVYEVVAAFKVGVRTPRPPADTPPPGGTEISHSTRVIVVDGKGRVRAYLRGGETPPEEVLQTVRRALE